MFISLHKPKKSKVILKNKHMTCLDNKFEVKSINKIKWNIIRIIYHTWCRLEMQLKEFCSLDYMHDFDFAMCFTLIFFSALLIFFSSLLSISNKKKIFFLYFSLVYNVGHWRMTNCHRSNDHHVRPSKIATTYGTPSFSFLLRENLASENDLFIAIGLKL